MCRAINFLLAPLVILLLAACQPTQTTTRAIFPEPTSSPLVAASATQLPSPAATSSPEPVPSPTTTPGPNASPTAQTQAEEPICFSPREILPFAFLPDNTHLLLRYTSGVQIIDLATQTETMDLSAPQNVLAAALSPDGKTLAWSLADNTIQLISLADQTPLATLAGHTEVVTKLRFTPAGDRLVSASHDFTTRIWDLAGQPPVVLQAGDVLGIGISPDGNTLATIPFDGPVSLWDLSGNPIGELGGSGGYDTSDAVFSTDGQYLAADLATGLFLWRLSDGEQLWDNHPNSMAITYSPDGQYLAYANIDDSSLVLASPDGSQVIRTLTAPAGRIWELFFSPDSSLLAATDGVEIPIWQTSDGALQYIGMSACP
jgi:WD40 repeat protein